MSPVLRAVAGCGVCATTVPAGASLGTSTATGAAPMARNTSSATERCTPTKLGVSPWLNAGTCVCALDPLGPVLLPFPVNAGTTHNNPTRNTITAATNSHTFDTPGSVGSCGSGIAGASEPAPLQFIAAYAGVQFQGFGQHLDISIVEALAASPDRRVPAILAYQWTHGGLSTRREAQDEVFIVGTHPCADGFIEIFLTVAQFHLLMEMMGQPEELKDPRFDTIAGRMENKGEVDAVFYTFLATHTKLEVWQAAQRAHVLCAPLYTTEDLLKDPHFNERGFWMTTTHPVMGAVTAPGRQMRLSDTPIELRRPAPLLGEHTVELLTGAGYATGEIARMRQAGAL